MYFLAFLNDKIKLEISEIAIIITIFIVKLSLEVTLKTNSSGNREIDRTFVDSIFLKNQSINAKTIVCGAGSWEQT